MAVLTIREDFEKTVLQADRPVLVDFWATWCGYCRRLSPVIDRLADSVGDRLAVVKVDIDEHEALAEKYGVDTIPTLMLFVGGKAGEPLVNPASQAAIETWLREAGVL